MSSKKDVTGFTVLFFVLAKFLLKICYFSSDQIKLPSYYVLGIREGSPTYFLVLILEVLETLRRLNING
ncbi:hypothetical protein JOC73_000805 [Alkaliphilus hydrothermalis]|uniref:Uncharacterized protein n=1 Tax=Alkaliphilus hydrothermalis TaxID=1482730 RepID=A0ABS2NMX0_9FIRM|nr:hypothetical protein [Alkaliphilus hydrothermalis]